MDRQNQEAYEKQQAEIKKQEDFIQKTLYVLQQQNVPKVVVNNLIKWNAFSRLNIKAK